MNKSILIGSFNKRKGTHNKGPSTNKSRSHGRRKPSNPEADDENTHRGSSTHFSDCNSIRLFTWSWTRTLCMRTDFVNNRRYHSTSSSAYEKKIKFSMYECQTIVNEWWPNSLTVRQAGWSRLFSFLLTSLDWILP